MFTPVAVRPSADSKRRLIIVNWNVHVGHGDVPGLIQKISRAEESNGFGNPEFVLLLQESFRHSAQIPASTGFTVPRRIAPPDPKMDIEYLARKLGWWMFYAPSMRNGDGPGEDAEDRGNAILSSLPLADVEGFELPFAVQRRVALTAIVLDTQNRPKLRVAVTHFDTRAPVLQGWVFGGPAARNKQAQGFVSALRKFKTDRLPLVVGGDLNTYIGSKTVIDTVSEIAPHTDCGNQVTHNWGGMLDHIFAGIPTTWRAQCVRGASEFGSDHYPLVFSLDVVW
jgi:endonuclease/exonuclease/phosphatase family metal-dependent hydrolase